MISASFEAIDIFSDWITILTSIFFIISVAHSREFHLSIQYCHEWNHFTLLRYVYLER